MGLRDKLKRIERDARSSLASFVLEDLSEQAKAERGE